MTFRPTRALRRQAALADLRRRERIAAALTFRANQRAIAKEVARLDYERRVRADLDRAGLAGFTFHPAPTPESSTS